MPTGYTADLYDGNPITFKEFVFKCARAFGALVEFRDEPITSTLPEFPPRDTYSDEALQQAKEDLARVKNMTLAECKAEADKNYDRYVKEAKESNQRRQAMRKRYNQMLQQVREWNPPTPQHNGLKKFMSQQIRESIKFDCFSSDIPQKQTAAEWKRSQLTYLKRHIKFCEKDVADNIKRYQERIAWVKALKNAF